MRNRFVRTVNEIFIILSPFASGGKYTFMFFKRFEF